MKSWAVSFIVRLLIGVLVLFGLGDCTAPSVTLQSPWQAMEYHPWGVSSDGVCDCGNHICRCLGIFHPIYVGDAPPNPPLNYFYVNCMGSAPPRGYQPTVGYLRSTCSNLRASN